ncbi:DUF5018 domain-containing protein [Jejuia pallidilutea]|uniref:DUF5018 domain-containing protein n=2 Tax=Jejuia pallidilutea TaxID=504487 RepID=A0A090VLU2_9FLAO|nr:DUF5018 domain-containing protein [Jejuia pallidilutea]GAL65696.1 hypothetical protein JCM19301_3381 [Jejuia pallidilutea]GAL88635.1 hypothetical protein JCM19538_3148 [Jejuia pallidilutea]
MKNISKVIKLGLFLFVGMLFTVTLSCNDDITFEDQVPDYAYSIIRSFDINNQSATINHSTGTITLTLPAGTNVSNLTVNMSLPEGATVEPASGSTVDFSEGPVVFTISNNGVSRPYTATVAAYGDPKIMTFSIGENDGVIDQENATIQVTVGSEANIKALAPQYTIPGGTTSTPQSGVAQDFTNPVKYTVLSNDGFTGKSYFVTVTQLKKALITSFKTGTDVCSVTGIIDDETSTINLDFPAGADLSAIAPIIEVTEGSTLSPASGVAQDFSAGAIEYAVTNVEGITKTYTVNARTITSSNKIAFISGADCVESISEPDTKAAALWLKANYAEDFVYLKASALTSADLANTKMVLLYWDNTGSQDMPDGGITTDKVEIITNYYKAGGHLMVEGFAINLLDDIGRININGTLLTNEGGNTNPVGGENLDAWGLRGSYTTPSPAASANHPILAGLDQGTTDYYPMNNANYKEDRNFGIDFGGEYNSLFTQPHCSEERALEFETATNSVLIRWYEWLDARGCGIGLAEFKPQGEYQGTMIVNTGGWLEWSMEDNNGAVNDYQGNIHLLHANVIDYLLN